MSGDKLSINPVPLDQNFQDAIKKGDVSTCGHGKPIIGDVGAEQSAARRRGHPVTFHTRLPIRIYQHHFGPKFFGFVKIFRSHGLVIRRIGAEENHQVRPVPVFVAAGRGRDADGVLHGGSAGSVTEPSSIIDIVGAEKAGDFLRHIIDFVRDSARGEEECQPLRLDDANSVGQALISFIPGDASETGGILFSEHGIGQPAKLAKLGIVEWSQFGNIFEQLYVQRGHSVEAKQIEPRHAQMNALDGPVVKTGDAQSTAIADAAAHYLPGIREVIAVFPKHRSHVAKMFRLGLTQAERHNRFQFGLPIFLKLVRWH